MQLRPALRLQTAIEALTHTIIPALDENNRLAQEQAQLVIGMLSNALQLLPLEYAYDRAELVCLVDAAGELGATHTGSDVGNSIEDAVTRAKDVLDRSAADPRELLESVRELRAALGSCVSMAYERGTAADRTLVGKAVLDAAARNAPLVRAAYLGHGFEGSSPTVPPLAELLATFE